MISLIDGDLVAYRCAASAENDGEEIALLRCEELMQNILQATQADSYKAFLTGGSNFRKEINPEYKANRKDKPLPIHLNACREYLVTEWKAQVTDGYEADDALGFNQLYYVSPLDGMSHSDTIIASLDKDMLQIPGKHYQWPISGTKKDGTQWFKEAQWYDVSYLDGLKHFYRQMLIGDISDNIKGVDGIGKVKAAKLIDHLETEEEMQNLVCRLYNNPDRFQVNADCLWIMREEGVEFSDRKMD